MGVAKRTRKFAAVKRLLNPNDSRVKQNKQSNKVNICNERNDKLREVPNVPSSLFFNYNNNLGPPFHILLDTNFINFSIQHKLDIFKGTMDCLVAKCIPCITDCVIGELEKMGHRYNLALKLARDPRFKRLHCLHKGTYADDCIVQRVTEHKCYIVGTNDTELKRRIRRIPGVPIMYVTNHKYSIERLPESLVSVPLKK
ncbi:Fcf1 family protein [Cryptosporidium meleagridis]|uniref:Fcf1 family protein n=1 Tax=Cryptosporidium meleagridis TaxID=93969 RepID=A0A2P4YYB2_9CRYT|nr:Fcf1 family protein [Cryptosporidium meleagridis]